MVISRIFSVIALAVVLASGIGCAAGPRVSSDGIAPEAPVAFDTVALAMDNARKSSELAQGFPFQVPVVGGEVVSSEVVSPDSVWVYEIRITEPVEVIAEWYRRSYANANWVLDSDEPGPGGSGRVLYFSKGAGAESVVELAADGSKAAYILATVALGAGITETY